MAQMWGFAHWKLKLSSARPRAPKQSTGLFLSFGLPCSNPVLYSKNKKPQKRLFIFGADVGIRTPEASLKTYTISNRAPSASSDNSPYTAGARCVRLFTFNPRPGSKRRTDSAFPQTYPWTAAWGWGWDNGRWSNRRKNRIRTPSQVRE